MYKQGNARGTGEVRRETSSIHFIVQCPGRPVTLKTLTSLNKEVRPFFLGDKSIWNRKLEKAVAVRNSLLEKFSGKFRRCWKIPHRFSGSTKCYPCQALGTFRQGKRLLENWPHLREHCWTFFSETATAFLSSSDLLTVCKLGALQKARLRKVHFSGDFLGAFDFLRIACSLGIPPENLQI